MSNVEVKIGGSWLTLPRTNNNQWPYYNTNGPWQKSMPIPVRITSVLNETVEDSITSETATVGQTQFSFLSGAASSNNHSSAQHNTSAPPSSPYGSPSPTSSHATNVSNSPAYPPRATSAAVAPLAPAGAPAHSPRSGSPLAGFGLPATVPDSAPAGAPSYEVAIAPASTPTLGPSAPLTHEPRRYGGPLGGLLGNLLPGGLPRPFEGGWYPSGGRRMRLS